MSSTSITPVCNKPPTSRRLRSAYAYGVRPRMTKAIRQSNVRWNVDVDSCRSYHCNGCTSPLPTVPSMVALAGSGSRADDSAPYELSLDSALKLLGVSKGASFDEILRAKKSILATCKDDQETISQVEAAYDLLLMQSLTQRRAGKVKSNSIRYADVKPDSPPIMKSMPQWLQTKIKNPPIGIDKPSVSNLGAPVGVYGAMMAVTYVNGASMGTSSAPYAGPDVPGLIIATSIGASLYFLTKKNVKLGQASLITIGGLVVGAVMGSAVENWLQVDIVPFLGLRSPAALVGEFIIFSQFLSSLYLR